MRKKKVDKKHTVSARMQVLELTKAGSSMELDIFANKIKLGTIIVGRGSLTWYGKSRRTGRTFSWTEFAKIMDEQTYQ
jgi:acetyl-CoA carboxylase carboxyltransferase component